MKTMKWLGRLAVLHGTLGLAAYLWLVDGSVMAGNIYKFLIWVFIAALILGAYAQSKEKAPPSLMRMNVFTYAWGAHIAMLAAIGHFVTAAGLAIGAILIIGQYSIAQKREAKKA